MRGDRNRSHYRGSNVGWQDLFNEHHIHLFDEVNGDLVDLLGY